jgi:hypothetical protein
MSLANNNPPSSASGPSSAAAAKQNLKRSVQQAFEGDKQTSLITEMLLLATSFPVTSLRAFQLRG